MIRLFFLIALCVSIHSTDTSAHGFGYRSPVVHRSVWNNVWVGYGGFSYWNWPVYTPVYGFTYVPYFNYNYPVYVPSFGAIAFSPDTQKYGFTSGGSSRFAAERAAINRCGASDCRTVVWVQGGCAVAAASKLNKSLGWGYARNRSNAQRLALQGCSNHGGSDCEAFAWVCSW